MCFQNATYLSVANLGKSTEGTAATGRAVGAVDGLLSVGGGPGRAGPGRVGRAMARERGILRGPVLATSLAKAKGPTSEPRTTCPSLATTALDVNPVKTPPTAGRQPICVT